MCSQNPTCFGVGHHHHQGRSTYDKIMHRLLRNTVYSVLRWWKKSIFFCPLKTSSNTKHRTHSRATVVLGMLTVLAVVGTIAIRVFLFFKFLLSFITCRIIGCYLSRQTRAQLTAKKAGYVYISPYVELSLCTP